MALHAEETQTFLSLIASSCCWCLSATGWLHCLMKNCLYSCFFTCANKAIFIHSSRWRTQRSLTDATRLLSSRLSPHDNLETGWFWESRTLTNGEVPENLISRKKSVHINSRRFNVDPLGQLLCVTQKSFRTQILLSQAIWVNSFLPRPKIIKLPTLWRSQWVSSLCRLS